VEKAPAQSAHALPLPMSQADKLYDLLSDGKPHRTDEILRVVYGGSHLGLSRATARISDLIKAGSVFLDRNGNEITGHNVKRGWKDDNNPTLYWYWMKRNLQLDEELTETELNAMLDGIIKKTPISWDNKGRLDQLHKAKKADAWQKRSIIAKFG
jgi:hypothetical protein